MMMMAIALYWVTFFIDSLNVECWLWVRQRRCLPGLERGHCQTHKVGKVSKIQWCPSCLSSSVNQSAIYPDQQVLQRSGLPLPVSADRLPSQVFLSKYISHLKWYSAKVLTMRYHELQVLKQPPHLPHPSYNVQWGSSTTVCLSGFEDFAMQFYQPSHFYLKNLFSFSHKRS